MMEPEEYEGWTIEGWGVTKDMSTKRERMKYVAIARPFPTASVFTAAILCEIFKELDDEEPVFRKIILQWNFGSRTWSDDLKSMEHGAIAQWDGFYRVAVANLKRKVDEHKLLMIARQIRRPKRTTSVL